MRTNSITQPTDDAQLTLLADITREARLRPPVPLRDGRRLWLVPEPRHGSARLNPSERGAARRTDGPGDRSNGAGTAGRTGTRTAGRTTRRRSTTRRAATQARSETRGRRDAADQARSETRGRRNAADQVTVLSRRDAKAGPAPRPGTAPGAPSEPAKGRRAAAKTLGQSQHGDGGASKRWGRADSRGSGGVRLTRRGRVVVVAFFVMVTLGICFAGARAASWAAQVTPAQSHAGQPWVEVNQGDTLWKIAEAATKDGDPARTVEEILRINALDDSLIRPGTRLYLPKS